MMRICSGFSGRQAQQTALTERSSSPSTVPGVSRGFLTRVRSVLSWWEGENVFSLWILFLSVLVKFHYQLVRILSHLGVGTSIEQLPLSDCGHVCKKLSRLTIDDG